MTTFTAPLDVGVVAVTGADRTSYLENVLTQDVDAVPVGGTAGALYLDQHGRPLAVMDVVVEDERILLVLPDRSLAEELAATLSSRTFLADARFEVLDHAGRAVRGRDVETPPTVVRIERDGGVDLVGPEDDLPPVDAGPETLEAWRIAHGQPGWGTEIRAPHLPEEAGVLPTHVHLQKGCYPGQEAVARMWMLGRPRRRLARVVLVGDARAGWTWGSGKQSVEVTSVADWDGERVGLAYVPADAEPGRRYEEDGAGVVVRDLVGDGLPVPGHDPAVRRRRDRRG